MAKALLALLLLHLSLHAQLGMPDKAPQQKSTQPVANEPQNQKIYRQSGVIVLEVTGEGAAPPNSMRPAQARIMAKRAALADAYRKMSERVAGVMVTGQDKIENMIVTQSLVQTKVKAVVKNAKIVDTKCDYDVCQVTLELRLRKKE